MNIVGKGIAKIDGMSIATGKPVYTDDLASKEALVVFIEGKKSNKKGGLKILPPLYVYNSDNKYTPEILKIFNYNEDKHA